MATENIVTTVPTRHAGVRHFIPIYAPGIGPFSTVSFGGFGLCVRCWVNAKIIVSLTLTISLESQLQR